MDAKKIPYTGRVCYPVDRWQKSLTDNPEMRQVVRLRSAILNFEAASKELLLACETAKVDELQLLAAHVKKQMENSISYAKSVFQRLNAIGDLMCENSKLGKINKARREYDKK